MPNSEDADRLRRRKCRNAVTTPTRHPGRLRINAVRQEAIVRGRFEAVHQILEERTSVAATAPLPVRVTASRHLRLAAFVTAERDLAEEGVWGAMEQGGQLSPANSPDVEVGG
jgi:hypothetical protein